MSMIIGVLGRPKVQDREFTSFSKAVTDVILKYDNIPLGIIPPVINIYGIMNEGDINKLKKCIDLCDGIILQGGTDYYQYDLEAIDYISEKNMPLLGVCLGMQSIGVNHGATLTETSKHSFPNVKYVHEVELKPNSFLGKIIGKSKINVNSRHNEMIINPKNIEVVGCSNNVIEAIERPDKLFFIGVQWHPEDMTDYDLDSVKIFDAFFTACEKYHFKGPKM